MSNGASVPPATPQNGGGEDATKKAKPKPKIEKKQNVPGPESNQKWIAPIILASIVSAAITFSALHGLWREWWVKWVLFPATLMAVGVAIYELLSTRTKFRKRNCVIISACSCVFLSGGILWVYKISSSPDFCIRATWMENETNSMRYIDDNGQIIPFAGAVLVEFINLKPVPLMIDSYAVEKIMPDGKWVRSDLIPRYGINRGRIFAGYDAFTNVTEWDYVSFDSAIQGKNIAPNETVQGWLFFKSYFDSRNLRFRFRDTLGNISTASFQGGSGIENGWPSQGLFQKSTTNKVDYRSLFRAPEQ